MEGALLLQQAEVEDAGDEGRLRCLVKLYFMAAGDVGGWWSDGGGMFAM